jgi:hypothetical protein
MTTITLTDAEQKSLVREAVADFINFMDSKTVFGTYRLDGGRKYLRIMAPGHVHCFVDALTGDVYMAASIAKPMLNGARYNLLDAGSFELLKSRWDQFGSYLYKRR